MVPTLNATTETTSAAPPTQTGPPQRQSCDRCHEKKLRCIRNKNNENGVCDRCLSKRAQCVYSISLPKGRPSLHRLAEESNAGGKGDTASSGMAQRTPSNILPTGLVPEPVKPLVVSSDPIAADHAGTDVDASTNMNVDTIHATSASMQPSVLSLLMDSSMDMSTGAWPWLDTSSWDEMQLETDWSSHDSSQLGIVLGSLDSFPGDGSVRESSDPSTPTQPLHRPSPPRHPTDGHGLPGVGNYEKHDGRTRSNMERIIGASNISLDKYNNYASLIITAHLSQLSMRLSSLRYSSCTLAQAAESSSGLLPNQRRVPLFQSAAFESVAAWVAHDQCSAIMNAYPSVHLPTEMTNHYPTPGHEGKSQSCQSILRDVFSSSHRLLDILRHLQVNNLVEQFSSTTTSAQTHNGSQQPGHSTISIIRHLVMACDALLLEIYAAVLIALQHDAYPGDSLNNTTALGDVRLVLVVQLCSYLIERQQQAVDQCFGPRIAQETDLSSSLPPGPVDLDAADREALSELRRQVQQRLLHLRQTLRCT